MNDVENLVHSHIEYFLALKKDILLFATTLDGPGKQAHCQILRDLTPQVESLRSQTHRGIR